MSLGKDETRVCGYIYILYIYNIYIIYIIYILYIIYYIYILYILYIYVDKYTFCAHAYELLQSHCGDNWEDTLIS